MEIKNCVLDTNILIYHLHDSLTQQGKTLLAEAMTNKAYISVLTRIELLGWQAHNTTSLQASLRLLQKLEEVTLSEPIVKTCIEIKQQYRIKLPDAIIAATALELSLPLLTRNADDFSKISTLQLINPFA